MPRFTSAMAWSSPCLCQHQLCPCPPKLPVYHPWQVLASPARPLASPAAVSEPPEKVANAKAPESTWRAHSKSSIKSNKRRVLQKKGGCLILRWIMMQMSEIWMAQSGSSTLSSPTPPSSQATPPPSTVFHVCQGGSRRQFVNHRQVESWQQIQTGSDPRILSVDASELTMVPWPSYQLSTDAKTRKALGTNLQQDLDLFLERQRVWMNIDATFIHSVSKDCDFVVRRRGVHVLATHSAGACTLTLQPEGGTHSTLNTIKDNIPLIILDPNADNDMKVSVITATFTGRKRRIKCEDDTLPHPHPPQRPCLAINTDISAGCVPPLSGTGLPPPSTLFLYSPSLLSASEPTTPLEPSEPVTLLEPSMPALKSPGRMYTVDVVNGILHMNLQELAGMNWGPRLVHVFKRPYNLVMYDDNVRHCLA
ncbi:hypothetical protein DFH09DRAFT_1069420 [Mycena vulgaris]|nr:hypothetical protein DFH09DRAFT_1069420 [Mycena vulgaris]